MYVDGRPRLAGTVAFLAWRGISLPTGAPDDPPGADYVTGLGRKKNALFREIVEGEGVEIDRGTIQLVRDLRASGIRVGVATPSRNGAALLRRAKIYDLFDALVGGVSSAELHVR